MKIKFEKPTLGYLCYPLSSNFEKNRKQALKLAKKLCKRHPKLVLILPHLTTHFNEEVSEFRSIYADLVILSRVDIVIIGQEKLNYNESAGSVWESQFSKFINKPIYYANQLLKQD